MFLQRFLQGHFGRSVLRGFDVVKKEGEDSTPAFFSAGRGVKLQRS